MEGVWGPASAALLFVASFGALLARIRRIPGLPLALASCVALSVLICFDTALLNGLSTFHGVTRTGVVLGHVGLIAGCLLPAPARTLTDLRVLLSRRIFRKRRWSLSLGLLPLLALAALSAVRYAPNNFDAMTYHLARVAHWIQNRSVGAYPTGIQRQLVLPAGSDYLLLQLQLVSGSDRLANLLQLICYVLVVLSGPSLARLAGTPSRFRWLGAVLVGTLPMAILQASSAQNDLVASVVAVAILATSLPFLHTRHPVSRRASRILLFSAALAAGILVKPTALFAAGPFVFLAALATAVRVGRRIEGARAYAIPVLGAAALGAIVCLPELERRNVYRHAPNLAAEFSYPVLGEWRDRAINSLRGLAHHIPPTKGIALALGLDAAHECSAPGPLCVTTQFRAHQDLVGNPVHAILLLGAVGLVAARWRAIPPRGRVSVVALVAAWLFFHAVLKDNPWLQRLELPIFALSPVLLPALLAGVPDRGRRRVRVAGAAALGLVLYAGVMAARNELSPPLGAGAPYERSYYDSFHSQSAPQDTALRLMLARDCLRVGLSLSEMGYDYPLTWRAMQRGARVRHVAVSDPWPCLLYSDHGEPEGARSAGWVPLAGLEDAGGKDVPFLFGRPR